MSEIELKVRVPLPQMATNAFQQDIQTHFIELRVLKVRTSFNFS